MTQVTGILIDEIGTVLANTTCAVVAIDQIVGQDGGGRVSRGSIVVTDGAGEFDADIKPGRYELVVEVSAPADANVKFRRIGRLSVLENGPMTLEEALDTHVTVTPGALLAAQAAAEAAADSAASAAGSATEAKQARDQAVAIAAEDLPSTVVLTAGDQTIAGVKTFTGQITGTAVTQSTTDTTAGRLMKVGDGGINGVSPLVGDMDDNPSGGILSYDAAAGSTNGPLRSDNGLPHGRGIAVVGRRFSSRRAQIFISEQFPFRGELYTRATDTDWTLPSANWQRHYSQLNLLGTVSQSSGVPTGAVIQRGSNANGEFVRFADGTQICTHRISTSASEAVTWTFPSAFSQSPRMATVPIAGGVPRYSTCSSPFTSSVSVYSWNSSGVQSSANVDVIAIGRWF